MDEQNIHITGEADLQPVVDEFNAAGDAAVKFADDVEKSTVALEDQIVISDKAINSLVRYEDAQTKAKLGVDGTTTAVDDQNTAVVNNTRVTNENTAAKEKQITMADRAALSQSRVTQAYVDAHTNLRLANEGYSKTYNNLTKLSSLGTPAIMKAATWSALGVGGVAYESIKQYMDFNKLMTQMVTQAGVNKNELPFLNAQALDTAKRTGVALNDIANAYYRIASGTAGWNGGKGATKQQLAGLVNQVANMDVLGNIQGGASSEQSARVLSAVVNAGLRGVGQSTNPHAANYNPNAFAQAAAYINAGVGASDIRQSEMTSALGKGVLLSAAANGVSMQDVLSWIGLLTSTGTPGPMAGTYVRSGLNLLTNQGTQGAKALAMIGIAPGEMQKILSGHATYNGLTGLTGAADLLRNSMQTFNPFANYPKYKGAGGRQGAINQLEAWGVNQIPKGFIDAWMAGKLTQTQQLQANTMILTKAFGGTKQFTTIESLIAGYNRLLGIESNIKTNANAKTYNKDVNMALNTPAAKWRRLVESFQVDLIKIGEAITPTFLKIAGYGMDVVNWLTKTKAVLIPLVSLLGVFLGAAGLAKIGQVGLGGYRVLGGIYKGTGKIWDTLAKAFPKDSLMQRTLHELGGGGKRFREVADMAGKTELEKAGMLYGRYTDVFAGAVDKFVYSEERGGVGGGGGGGGRGAKGVEKRLEKDLENKAKSEIEKKAKNEIDGKLLNAVERQALKDAEGGPVTKAALRDLYTATRSDLGKGFGSEAKNLIETSFTKLKGVTGIAGDAEKAGTSLLEKVGFGSIGEMGVGDLLGSGLGALGGPLGMAAMSVLMPMAMPYITKGIGSIISFFGGHGPTAAPTVATPTSVKAKLTAAQIALKNAQSKYASDLMAGKSTTADIAAIKKYGGNVSTLTGVYNGLSGEAGFKKTYAQFTSATSMKQLENQILGHGRGNNAGSWKELQRYIKMRGLMKNLDPQTQMALSAALGQHNLANFNSILGGTRGQLASSLENNFQGFLMKKDPNWFNSIKAGRSAIAANALIASMLPSSTVFHGARGYGTVTNNPYSFSAKDPNSAYSAYMKAMINSLSLTKQSKEDAALAKSSTGAVAKAYKEQSEKLAEAAKHLKSIASSIDGKMEFSPKTISDFANMAAAANKQVYTELGLTASQFAAAMVSALTSPAGTKVIHTAAVTGAKNATSNA